MSFLLRTLPRPSTLSATSCILPTTTTHTCRTITSTPIARKTATETVKDSIKTVDKTVSQAAVKGIDAGEKAASSLKASTTTKAGQAEGSAKAMAGEAKGKAAEMKGEAKGKAGEVKGKM